MSKRGISLRSVKNNIRLKKLGYDYKICYATGDDGFRCGKRAYKNIEMPFGIPDMPNCKYHYEQNYIDIKDLEELFEEYKDEIEW